MTSSYGSSLPPRDRRAFAELERQIKLTEERRPKGVVYVGALRDEGGGLITTAASTYEDLVPTFSFTFKANRWYRIEGHVRAVIASATAGNMYTRLNINSVVMLDSYCTTQVGFFNGSTAVCRVKYLVDSTFNVQWQVQTTSVCNVYTNLGASFTIYDEGFDPTL